MLQPLTTEQRPPQENATERPVASAEQWLGRNASARRRLWERLNPLHRKQLQVVARALVLHQRQGRLPEPLQARLRSVLEDFSRLVTRVELLLTELRIREKSGPCG